VASQAQRSAFDTAKPAESPLEVLCKQWKQRTSLLCKHADESRLANLVVKQAKFHLSDDVASTVK